jgi:hypothetical protein
MKLYSVGQENEDIEGNLEIGQLWSSRNPQTGSKFYELVTRAGA